MSRYVALLRGINVGGRNLIRMPSLKACFEANGFRNATTYIQSGNVLFDSDGASAAALVARIEDILTRTFGYPASVVLRDRRQMRRIIAGAPDGFGTHPDEYRYDVIFLKEPLTSKQAVTSVPAREGVDTVHTGSGVLYFARLISRASHSQLGRLVSLPIYRSMTIRNWNTTTKLHRMMADAD